eukprot:SAG22_NODE_24281_length_116_cov_45123.352941_1_plen_22_part_01
MPCRFVLLFAVRRACATAYIEL